MSAELEAAGSAILYLDGFARGRPRDSGGEYREWLALNRTEPRG